jgi:hypothetical protein
MYAVILALALFIWQTQTITGPISTGATGPSLRTETPFSAAGTPLPTCTSVNVNSYATVSDQTSAPTYFGAYTSGGTRTAPVLCAYNGSTYSWVTY